MFTVVIPNELDQQLSGITDDKNEFILSAIKQEILL
jgi:hypothetical protein